jgi:hypothetical protein
MLPGQLDLLSWKGAGARRTDPDTSQEAANKVRSRKVYADVLRVLRDFGPATDFEIAARLGGQQTSIGKRRGELRDAGLVADSGERRPSPSGSNAIVWKIKGE